MPSSEGILAPPHTFPPFRSAAVLGAGTMGAQIAAHLANAGLEVHLLDIPPKEGADKNQVVRSGFERAKKMKPDPFYTPDAAERVTLGNFEEDLDRISAVEWVVEAVVERLDVKRSLMARIDEIVHQETIVSTNTSGLSIADISEGLSESVQSRFLGTHFFNPPRYLKLLELVPSEKTAPDVIARLAHFGRIHLGKGIVIAKDTPYFIGNRVGVYAMLQAMRAFTDGKYSIEEIDTLTGRLVGRPKSATFRTADVVGLDVMLDVATNLYEAVPDDESRGAFQAPELLQRLVQEKRLGQKTGAGFYRKDGREIKSVEPDSLDYSPGEEVNLPELDDVRKAGGLEDQLRRLFSANGRAGEFFRDTTLDLLAYSARRIPEITETPADIDRAIRWGFGWELGPFQIWDALGFDEVRRAMAARNVELPEWVREMGEGSTFYQRENGRRTVFVPPVHDFREDPRPDDLIDLDLIRSAPKAEMWSSDACGLMDLGDGVALLEFRSKANTLGHAVMDGLREAVGRVEEDRSIKGMVIANDGKNFSVGANLAEMAEAVQKGAHGEIDTYLKDFQATIQRVRYARKPVVVAVHQRALGGGCELLMACPHPVAAAETYMGLVELGVGLIPAGTGSARLAAEASNRAANGHPSEIQAWLRKFFETVAMSTVSTSAREGQALGFLPPHARIVMNEDRRFHVAKEEVMRLSSEGYYPPSPQKTVHVLGRPGRAAFEVLVQQYVEGNFISAYDSFLANRLAFVLTGGELTAPQSVPEEYLIDLERQIFLELVQQEKTQARIEHMLKTRKPLRN